MATFPGGSTQEAFRFVWKHRERYSVKALCRHLKVSRSGYYAWLHRKPSQRAVQNAELLGHIHRIYTASHHRYGSPKVYQALHREGIVAGENRIARLMREWGMKARVSRVYRRLLKRREELKALPNHRLVETKPVGIDQQWSSDVTYIRLGRRWVYLAVVLDLYSRRVIGWQLAERLDGDLSRGALRQAFTSRHISRKAYVLRKTAFKSLS